MPSAVFPRTLIPRHVTPMRVPTGLVSRGGTGKDHLRSVVAMGREWTETWGILKAGSEDVEEFLAWIEWAYNASKTFAITHLTTPGSGLAPLGAGGGTPLVNGAAQTGETLNTDGWSNNITGVVKAGDVIRVAGISPLLRITEDANSNGSGQAALKISPFIPSGMSAADNAVITRAGNTLNAYIAAPPNLPDVPPGRRFAGLSLAFREAL